MQGLILLFKQPTGLKIYYLSYCVSVWIVPDICADGGGERAEQGGAEGSHHPQVPQAGAPPGEDTAVRIVLTLMHNTYQADHYEVGNGVWRCMCIYADIIFLVVAGV